MTTTIADASRLARFLFAADAVAKALSNHYPSSDDCRGVTGTYEAVLAEYVAARDAFAGVPTPPPGKSPWPTGSFR